VPLTPERLDAFVELLGDGAFGGCFCAVWTAFDDDWAARCADPQRPNLAETRRRVLAGEHVGFLVYDDEALVGWTGSGPKSAFPLLESKLASRLSPISDDVWSIGCIAVAASERGSGLSTRIVDAVVESARDAAAHAVEAYPTATWDEPRSYRGAATTYREAGFEEAGREHDGDDDILLLRRELR